MTEKKLINTVLAWAWEYRTVYEKRALPPFTVSVTVSVGKRFLRQRHEVPTLHAPWGWTCRSGWWLCRRTLWVGPDRSPRRRCQRLTGAHRSPKLRPQRSWRVSWPSPASSARTRPSPKGQPSWERGFFLFGSWVRVWSSTARTDPSRFGCFPAQPGSSFSYPTRLVSGSLSSSNTLWRPCTRWPWYPPSFFFSLSLSQNANKTGLGGWEMEEWRKEIIKLGACRRNNTWHWHGWHPLCMQYWS